MVFVLRWWLVCFVLGVVALPLTTWFFRRLPGSGLAWAKPLGLLVVGYLSWLLAMFQFSGFNLVAIVLSTLVLATLSWFVWRPHWSTVNLKQQVRRYWRAWLAYELLFACLFGLGIWLRIHGAYGTGIYGTEKPMELMLLNSILSSSEFPPKDLWLAGYSINYYYLGYVFVGVLATMSIVPVGVAFNLGVATILALAGVAVAGMVATLVALAQQPRETQPLINWGQVGAALLAVGLVFFVGNQLGALNRIAGTSQLNKLTDSQKLSVLAQALRGETEKRVDPVTLRLADNSGSSTLKPMTDFDFWAPSRAIYDQVGVDMITVDGVEREGIKIYEVITEFPFFSFYLGDMHPHVLALPWVILALALALALVMRSELPTWTGNARSWLELLLSALMIGSLYAINSWDAPTYGLVFAASLLLLYQRVQPGQWRTWWRSFLKQMVLLVGAALILLSPFLLTFKSFAGRNDVPEAFDLPIIGTIGRIIAPVRSHTSFVTLLIIFGLFLIPLVAWVFPKVMATRWQLKTAVLLGSFVLGLVLGFPLLFFIPLTYWLFEAVWRTADQPLHAFVLLICAIGALLLTFTELFYLRDVFDNRLNTIFKFFYQIWLMWGMVAAWSIWRLLSDQRWKERKTLVWAPLFMLFLVGSLVYPFSAIPRNQNPPTELDGTITSGYTPEPARMLADWLKLNAAKDAIIVSNPGNSYQNGGEVAALSGRATLLAWKGHEGLWRSKQPAASEQVGAREFAITQIYSATNPQEVTQLLNQYDVDYVVWGPNEQQLAPQASPQVFNEIGTIVYEYQGWVLYQVP